MQTIDIVVKEINNPERIFEVLKRNEQLKTALKKAYNYNFERYKKANKYINETNKELGVFQKKYDEILDNLGELLSVLKLLGVDITNATERGFEV